MENPRRTYTLEEVNAFRAEVHRILTKEMNVAEEEAQTICGYNGYTINGQSVNENELPHAVIVQHWSYIMQCNTPWQYAYWSSI